MKKVSTVAAKQIGNISEQKLTIGLDLGESIKLVLRAGRSGVRPTPAYFLWRTSSTTCRTAVNTASGSPSMS